MRPALIVFGVLSLLAVSTPVYAQDLYYLTNVSGLIVDLAELLVPVLTGLALAVFIWGLVKFMYNSDNEKVREEGKQRMVWGVIILFVIVSVWGIVSIVQNMVEVDSGSQGLTPPGIPPK